MNRTAFCAAAATAVGLSATSALGQVPAIGVPQLSMIQTLNQGPIPNIRNDCCGLIYYRSTQFVPPPKIPGWFNALGQELAYTMRIVSETRELGIKEVEDIGYDGVYQQQRMVVFFAGNIQAPFVPWAEGGPGASNFEQYFCCVPNDGKPHTVQVNYNTYDYAVNKVYDNGRELLWIATGGSWTGGFQPYLKDMPFFVNMDSPDVAGYGIWPGFTGFDGTQSSLGWFSWDTGLALQIVLSHAGDTSTFYNNQGSGGNLAPGQLFEGLGMYGGFPPYDTSE